MATPRKGPEVFLQGHESLGFQGGCDLPACDLPCPCVGDRAKDKALSITQSDSGGD